MLLCLKTAAIIIVLSMKAAQTASEMQVTSGPFSLKEKMESFLCFFPREIFVLHLNESYECIVEDYATIQSDVREEFLVTWKT